MWVTQLDVWSLVRFAELWVVNRDLKASDFSFMSWMDLLVAKLVEDLEPLDELEDPEGPATAGWKTTGKTKPQEEDENQEEWGTKW